VQLTSFHSSGADLGLSPSVPNTWGAAADGRRFHRAVRLFALEQAFSQYRLRIGIRFRLCDSWASYITPDIPVLQFLERGVSPHRLRAAHPRFAGRAAPMHTTEISACSRLPADGLTHLYLSDEDGRPSCCASDEGSRKTRRLVAAGRALRVKI
jgi:hypothetical protein